MSSAGNMKLVCFITINGVDTLKVLTTVAGLPQNAAFLKTKPGVGKPYMMFSTLTGVVAAAEFDGLPLVDNDVNVNATNIQAMLDDPNLIDRLTFA